MNWCSETVKMGVPRAAQALAERAGQPQVLESETYLNSTSQGELVLSKPKEDPRTPGKTPIAKAWHRRHCGKRRCSG
jgi:hypothetical protein